MGAFRAGRATQPLVVVRTGLAGPHEWRGMIPWISLTGVFVNEGSAEARRRWPDAESTRQAANAAARVSIAALRIALPAAQQKMQCFIHSCPQATVFWILGVIAIVGWGSGHLPLPLMIEPALLCLGITAVFIALPDTQRAWYAAVQDHADAALHGTRLPDDRREPDTPPPSPRRRPSGREGHDGVSLRELDDEALLEVIVHTLARSGLRAEVERQPSLRRCNDCAYSRAAWRRCCRTRRLQPEFLILSTFNFLFYAAADEGVPQRRPKLTGAATGYVAPAAAAPGGAGRDDDDADAAGVGL
jgi:hypothetical protein